MKEKIKITKFINSNETYTPGETDYLYFVEMENLEGEHSIEFSPQSAKIELRDYDIEISVEYIIKFEGYDEWIEGEVKYTHLTDDDNVIETYYIHKKFCHLQDFMYKAFKREARKFIQENKQIKQ